MWLCSSSHLAGASPLPLDVGYLLWGGANILLSMFVQQQIVILESSQEKMSAHPSTPPSWKEKAFDCVDHNNLWKILKEMEIPDHLTCLLRNLYSGQEATVRTGHGTIDWFQIGKGVHQGCILSSCLFNSYAEYIMQNVGLDEAQAGIKISRRNTVTSDMQMTPHLWRKAKRN